jgi:hypothetical protein
MKNAEHEHAKFTKDALALRKFGKAKTISSVGSGDGAFAGSSVGSQVSLHKQASGASHKFLSASSF